MKNLWILASALWACGCAAKTPPPAEVSATNTVSQPVAAVPTALPTVVTPPMPVQSSQSGEPPLPDTPAYTLSFDERNGDPPGTYWRNVVRKSAEERAANQQAASDQQAVINSQLSKERTEANERLNQVRELRRQQTMLEKQSEELSRKNPDFVAGGAEAIQRVNDERADLIREKQREIDRIQARR